jgi:hypothetical protein
MKATEAQRGNSDFFSCTISWSRDTTQKNKMLSRGHEYNPVRNEQQNVISFPRDTTKKKILSRSHEI